jgi:hypothetical protein
MLDWTIKFFLIITIILLTTIFVSYLFGILYISFSFLALDNFTTNMLYL